MLEVNTNQTPQTSAKPLVFRSFSDLYHNPPEDVPFVVQNLLPTGGLSVLLGKPKAGKSTLARQLLVAVAQGGDFLGRNCEQGDVLYVALEEKESEVVSHLKQLGLRQTDPLGIVLSTTGTGSPVEALRQSLEAKPNVRLVVIDPVFRFLP